MVTLASHPSEETGRGRSHLSPLVRKAIYLSLGGNTLLFAGKLLLSWHINSLAVAADAFHSLSDSFTTLLVFIGLWAAAKAPDEHHPFGHGRVEYVGTLVLAVLLFVAGFELGREAVTALYETGDRDVEVSAWAIAILLVSVFLKEAMARYVQWIGKLEGSNLLGADALHHRMDALTTLVVTLGLMGIAAGYPVLDDIMGLLVGVVVGYSGLALGLGAASQLIGREPSTELMEQINEAALVIEGLSSPHHVWVHDYGSSLAVAFHVGADPELTLKQAHQLATSLEQRLSPVVKGPVMVHLDPWDEL